LVVGSHRRAYELIPAIIIWLAVGVFAAVSVLAFWNRTSEGFDAWAAIFSPVLLWLFFGASVYVELFKRADRLVITPEAIEVSMRASSSFRARWRDLREVRERKQAFRHTFILVFADGNTVVFGTHRGDDEAEPLQQALRRLASWAHWSTPRWWDRLLYL
jgi:H+/Cl- antiporter ClcA